MNPIRTIVLCFLMIISSTLHAEMQNQFTERKIEVETSTKGFRHLTVNEGFSHTAVMDILQAENGIMWFASWDGLYKFDGYKLVKVCQAQHPISGETKVINSIVETNDNQIWIKTTTGIYIWNDETQNIKYFNPQIHNDSIEGQYVFLEKSSNDHIWFGTSNNKIYSYEIKSEKLQKEAELPYSKNTNLQSLYVDKEQNVWIYTKQNGIFRLTDAGHSDKKELTRDPLFDFANSQSIYCFFQDSKMNYWVATSKAIYCVAPQQIGNISYKYEYPSNLSETELKISNFDEYDHQIAASCDQGLFFFDRQKDEAKWIVSDISNRFTGLNDNDLTSVLFDKEGGLWIGTFNGGTNYLSPTSENFSSFNFINNKIRGHVVSSFSEDSQHNLWIGTEDGGYSFWKRQTDEVVNFYANEKSPLSPTSNNVQSILTKGECVYVGMYDKGMDIINFKTHSKKNYNRNNTFPDPLPGSVYGFHQLYDGNILIATANGLYLFDHQQQFHKVPGCMGRIKSIIQDDDEDIWVASKHGLYHYSKNLILQKHFKKVTNNSPSDEYDDIVTLTPFGSIIYIGTNGKGLWCLQKNGKKFSQLAGQALKDIDISKIIVHKYDLWLSTNKGIYSYNTSTHDVTVYTVQDGLIYKQFKNGSGIITDGSTIFFGSMFGITGFYPRELVHNNTQPQIVITDLYLFNKPVNCFDQESPLKKNISHSDKITLSQKQNNFTFLFSSSSYSQTVSNIYEYKLEPFDKEWQRSANGSNAAYYTNLPAGKYTLHVRTNNGRNQWSEEKCLKVDIRPFWWSSVPMKILYVLLLVGLIGISISQYARKKKKEIYMLRLEKEQEVYHSKMEFFTFMVHEIRTPLTLILGPLTDVMERKGNIEDAQSELSTIKRNANRLLALVNQLMDFRKVEEKSYTVQIRKVDLNKLTQKIAQNFEYSCSQKNIALVQQLPEKQCWAMGDEEALNKVLTNLLSNATKFTTDRIEIGLSLSEDNHMWNISVKDNGRGIGKTDQTKIFNSFYQIRQNLPNDYIGTGVGLSVVKHLLELQGGSISIESKIGQGACFMASVPICETVSSEENQVADENRQVKNVPTATSNKNRLLIAEDNDEMRKYIQSIFKPLYEVDTCANGKEALALTGQHAYDLVITDWMMPEIDGITLLKTLKNQDTTCHIPIVILTAKDDESSQIEGFTTQADAYVVKPFSSKVLLSQVNAIIQNREAVHKEFLKQPDTTDDILCQNDLDKIFLKKLNDLIEENMMDTNFSIDELATNLYMGRTSFYQKIKGIAGVTPNEYINTYKLKKAAHLLRKGNIRINEICYMMGFSTSSYFAKKFTAQFGMSPTEYQKSHKNE